MTHYLFLMRHAKSSWAEAGLSDRHRPLNARGQRDAPRMGQWLAQRSILPQHIVASSAVRTQTTAELMAQALGLSTERLSTDSHIYEAGVSDLLGVMRRFAALPEAPSRVLLIGHNPGLTDLINSIPQVYIDNVPTSGLAVVQLAIAQWSDLDLAAAELMAFQYPKQLEPQQGQ